MFKRTQSSRSAHSALAVLLFCLRFRRLAGNPSHLDAQCAVATVCQLVLTIFLWLCFAAANAVPPDTPITNTAVVGYTVAGNAYQGSANLTVFTDPLAGNSPPFDITLTQPSLAENQVGVSVSELVIADPDPGDTHTLSVSDPRFEIVGSELRLVAGESLNFEAEPLVTLTVTATDAQGAQVTLDLTLTVENVNEVPDDITVDGATVEANTPGAFVGAIASSDPDANDTATYTFDDPRFEVVGGQLKLLDGQSVPLGEQITLTITVTDTGGLSYQEVFVFNTVPAGSGNPLLAEITPLRLAPTDPLAVPEAIRATTCRTTSGDVQLPPPVSLVGSVPAIPANVSAVPTTVLKSGDVLFLRVRDLDANLDNNVAEVIETQLSTVSGDSETLVLTETQPGSGIFAGYVQTVGQAAVPGDCSLAVGLDDLITLDYTDANNPVDVAQTFVRVDPLARVFDSATGQLINGARIALVDATSGTPASVFADDGVTPLAAEQVSGNANGDGMFRFPFVGSGNYQLNVTPPNRFTFPTVVADTALQLLPGAPFALSIGSRGNPLAIPDGPLLHVDIPLDLQPVVRSPAELTLYALAPTGSGDPLSVQVTQCFDGTEFVPSPVPVNPGGAGLAVPQSLLLEARARFKRGDSLFIELIDTDQDLNPFAPDTVEVSVTTPDGDSERLQLRETNDSTGVFTGYLQTTPSSQINPQNCQLETSANSNAGLRYVDAADSQDVQSAEVLLDPGFTVFSSADGRLVDGATITLIDDATGLAASGAVFSEDGVTAFPATVVSGGSVNDAAGRTFDFARGTFLFPVIVPGRYRLQVDPPIAYTFPSVVADGELNGLANGPFVLQSGSRGEVFDVLANQLVAFDTPLDPVAVDIFVSKQSSREAAAVGDFIQYQITVENNDALAGVVEAELLDTLPPGFRFASGSLQIDRQPVADPDIGQNGRDLSIPLDDIQPGSSLDIRYVVEVAAGARSGLARNSATLAGVGIGAVNTAFADVMVRDELMRSVSIIVGQVLEVDADGCETTHGVPGVRVWLENGSFVVTDAQGKYHFADVEPGTHVLQLDNASLPHHLEPAVCEENTQFAGKAISQFVDLAAGTLWRSNFYVQPKPALRSNVVTRLDVTGQPEQGLVSYTYRIVSGSIPLHKLRATVMLDEALSFVPGSAVLVSEAAPGTDASAESQLDDPAGVVSNALTFKLPDTSVDAVLNLSFTARVRAATLRSQRAGVAGAPLDTSALLAFRTRAGKHRTEVSRSQLGLVWPASLSTLVDTTDQIRRARARRGNAEALHKARQKNAHALPDKTLSSAPAEDHLVVVGGVHEPSLGDNRARSKTSRTKVSVALDEQPEAPYTLPELNRGEAPEFDAQWLEANQALTGIAWPPENFIPVMPAIPVAVLHASAVKPQLLVDGVLVNPLTFSGTVTHHELGLTLSVWHGVPISERDSVLDVRLLDAKNVTVNSFTRQVHYGSGAARAEFVEELSYLRADGLHPPVVAVKLFDRAGYPVRAGTTGEFSVSPPFTPLNKTRHLENVSNEFNANRYRVLRDGVAYVQLEPTTETGELNLHFQFDQVRSETIRARLVPGARDWIMVGLAEGIFGLNDVSGDGLGAAAAGLGDEPLTDGRVAFYAKGMVRGDWLLTAAYDTDKRFERELKQQIDPNQFYTLYGDGSSQLFDAQSQRKLYLKLERDRFDGVLGDFDTGFRRSELTRYERRMHGLNVGYYGDRFELKAFASETDQAFVRDELRGDGTSGIYRLSRQHLVRFSETLRIVTRDRFRPEIEVSNAVLNRFADYTIDYDRGTVLFKQPVFSQDEAFNPVFIEVEYEVAGANADDEIVGGARLAYRLDNQDSEVALTYVDDGTEGLGGELMGLDVTWQLDTRRRLTAEMASSDTAISGSADAYLLQFEHAGEDLAGRVYIREQDDGFGLGHQASVEQGTRKAGVEGEYRIGETTLVGAQLFRQELLSTGDVRTVINAQAEHQRWGVQWRGGLRGVQEETSTGAQDTAQVTLGATRSVLSNRLVLRADTEMGLGDDEVADYPTRAIVGAEYKLPKNVRLFAEQEISWGDVRDTQDTRVGVRGRPWNGADMGTVIQREQGELGERLFATTGLLQQFRLNDVWLLDVGVDRVQTLKRARTEAEAVQGLTYNPNVPVASGSVNNDFSAFFVGAGYQREVWNVNSRLELHQGDNSDKWNLLLGANRQLAEGRVISSSMAALTEDLHLGGRNNSIDLRVGLAWRPDGSQWTFLNRADLVFEERQSATFDTTSRRWVNNFSGNYRHNDHHQASLQVGSRYVVDEIDGRDYDSWTLLLGGEYRYNFADRWDLSAHASWLGSTAADVAEKSWGLALGFQAFTNSWFSVGYNFDGFTDDDFIGADYTAKGPYLKLRLKFDQAVLKRFLEPAGRSRERAGATIQH